MPSLFAQSMLTVFCFELWDSHHKELASSTPDDDKDCGAEPSDSTQADSFEGTINGLDAETVWAATMQLAYLHRTK